MSYKDLGYVSGRVYKGVNIPNYKGHMLTSQQLRSLNPKDIVGKPIYYEHDYEKEKIGSIVEYWVDDEDWLNIGAYIFSDTDFRKDVLNNIRNGDLRHFSIGYLMPTPESGVDISNKEIIETSITSDPAIPGSNILLCYSKNKKKKQNKYIDIPFDKDSQLFIKIQNSKMSSENQEVKINQEPSNNENVIDDTDDVFDIAGRIKGKPQEEIVKMMTASVKNAHSVNQKLEQLRREKEELERTHQSQNQKEREELEALRRFKQQQEEKYIEQQLPIFEKVKENLTKLGLMDEKNQEQVEYLKKKITDPNGNKSSDLIINLTGKNIKLSEENEELKRQTDQWNNIFNGMKAGNSLPSNEFQKYSNEYVAVQNNKKNARKFVDAFFTEQEEEHEEIQQPPCKKRVVQNSSKASNNNNINDNGYSELKKNYSDRTISNSLFGKDPKLFREIMDFKHDLM